MPIRSQLETLLQRVPAATGAILADWEGEAVDCVAHMDEFELKVLGAHVGIVLTRLRQTLDRQETDRLNELVFMTETGRSLVVPLSEDYFLVLVTKREALLGKAQFELRRAAVELRKEIP